MSQPPGIRGNSGVGNAQSGGTQGFRFGDLKRRLPAIPLFNLASAPGETVPLLETTETQRLILKGLSGVLNVHIGVGVEGADGVVRPTDIPAGASTMQLRPILLFPDVAKKVYMREVFQDPTLVGTDNANHPLPVDIPFGWEGSTEADQIEIEVITDPALWIAGEGFTPLNGRIVCEVTIEYNGQWWDQQAIQQGISQVTLEGPSNTSLTILTEGGE
jgi:hypothetical protein